MLLEALEHKSSQGSPMRISTAVRHGAAACSARGLSSGSISSQVKRRVEGKSLSNDELQRLATPLDERTANVQESPPSSTKEKHLPNSAAKRRNEVDVDDSNVVAAKRLKRTPANLEVPSTSKTADGISSQHSQQSPGAKLFSTQPQMPSGSRTGTVVGTHAPEPGKSRKAKPARKGSRSDRYSTRFAQK